MNSFELKTALLAKHAQHVVVIHFPIALFMASAFFDLLARWRRDRALATAAYYKLAISGGRERSDAEYRALLDAAGLRLTTVVPTVSPLSVIEAVRK